MTIIQSIVLGIVQGLTEFIPVSSSGHLVLIPFFFNWPQQSITFDVMVHLGTLGAVLVYFRKEVAYLVKTTIKVLQRIIAKPDILLNIDNFNGDRLPVLMVIATIPVGIAGLMFGNRLSEATSSPYIVAAMLIIVGLVMWFVEKRFRVKKTLAEIDFYDALMIGASQALAMVRGVSRSGATMITGKVLGFSNKDAAKFSFLLSIVTIGLAGLLETFKLLTGGIGFEWLPGIIGFGTSFVSGFFAIKLFMGLLEKFGFKPFVIYRVLLGIAVIVIAIIFK